MCLCLIGRLTYIYICIWQHWRCVRIYIFCILKHGFDFRYISFKLFIITFWYFVCILTISIIYTLSDLKTLWYSHHLHSFFICLLFIRSKARCECDLNTLLDIISKMHLVLLRNSHTLAFILTIGQWVWMVLIAVMSVNTFMKWTNKRPHHWFYLD